MLETTTRGRIVHTLFQHKHAADHPTLKRVGGDGAC